ncbi:E3 ubiquitin-protein ligase RGLG3 [Glycine max]|nr:E3 ubiquitin-protein ligase RGLG3 [Glycine max]
MYKECTFGATTKEEGMPVIMGNSESMYESQDNFYQHPPSYYNSYHQPSPYAENSENTTYHEPSSYAWNSSNTTYYQSSTYAGSSENTRHQHTRQPTYIADNFSSLDQVVSSLREAGLESSNLILGIDFTKSNEWTGKHSFHRKSLHHIGNTPNPYEQAISIVGHTLSSFDEDNLIPCFGFGDASTHDQNVFCFYQDNRFCHGFEEVLARYREIVPYIKLSVWCIWQERNYKIFSWRSLPTLLGVGPTSFAPVIDAAIDIVERNNGQYHVLVIIADGQVTRNPDVPYGKLSPQEQATINSIIAASHYPLSIILVGVGDGPWDEMKYFDDNITERLFDNFQFVNFTKIMSENTEASKKEATFALAALMEIPLQYRAAQNIQLNDRKSVLHQHKRPLPPPNEVIHHDNARMAIPHMPNLESAESTAPAAAEPVCPICLTNPKDMAFGCGHTTCKECGSTLSSCPMCRHQITTRLRLYT